MSVATAPARPTVPTRHLFTVEDYYRMGEAGLFQPGTRVELIDGGIWDMNPIGSRHAICVKRLIRMFSTQIGDNAILQVQDSVRLNDSSEPEPDVALVRLPMERYENTLPAPPDVLLLIEVAGTSLEYDRDVKGPHYARSGIAEYWIVDLAGSQVLVFSDPAGGKYHTPTVARPGEVLVPRLLPRVSVAVSEVLGVG